jgi:hypothetical protein
VKGTASEAAEKPSIRIRVCLQAYRKSLKMGSALAAGLDVPGVNDFFRSLFSRATRAAIGSGFSR